MRFLVGVIAVMATSCVNATQDPYKFSKGDLEIGGKTVRVEIADTDSLRERGLMFRKSLDGNTGMLFIFANEQRRNFWMKNTFIPLSIGYFDKDKKLIEVFEMTPVKSEMQMDIPAYPSTRPAQYALEMPKEWFQKNSIKAGTSFKLKRD
jgi:uncharacterized protein